MEIERRLLQLNRNNYLRWKFEIRAVLEVEDCLDVVDGRIVQPTIDEAKIKVWKKTDATARRIIVMSLDDYHRALIQPCKTSKEMWDEILQMKELATVSNILQASKEFYTYSWKPGMTVFNFIAGLKKIVSYTGNTWTKASGIDCR